MVIKVNKSVLGEDWFQSFSAFRLNPETFLDKRKLTRDAFCFDAVKDLYSDYIENQYKIHLLLLLQEHSSLLIKDVNLLEQVVGGLMNLCPVLGTKPDKRILKSQTLVTVVTIILSWNLEKDIYKFVIKIQTLLLEIIYNSSEDSVVISSACKCLEELEEFYANNLESEVIEIVGACEKETSPAFQSYVILLSKCVKNIAAKLNDVSNITATQSGTLVRKENIQISLLVSNLLEFLPLMTHIAMYRVLKDLINIAKHTSEVSPMTFKLYLQNLTMSSNVPLFHLAFDLHEAFGSQLFSAQDEISLFKQLTKMSTHPCLTSSHRLLYLDWLKSSVKTNAYLTSPAFHPDLCILLPAPFDGPLTQEKKSNILALCIPPETKDNLTGEFLNESVNGLIKCSLLSGGTKAAPSLFRTLFVYFSSHKSEIMHNSMYRLLTGIVKTSLHLTPYALSFLEAVRTECGTSKFHEKVLDHLVEHILSVPMKLFYNNLEYYLNILESAVQESASICRPRAVLRLFQRLLTDPILQIPNPWSTGNDILTICRLYLQHHDVQVFYYDLAEVLCLIIQNADDIDVKDRAKIYYSMLTSLSKLKIQTIFSLQSSEKEAKNALNSFVTGGDSFQSASSIQKLSKPIIQLIRDEQNSEICINELDNAGEEFSDVLEMYHQHLKDYEPILKVPFLLKHINNETGTFSDLYSLIITTQSDPAAKNISVIEIPVLKDSKIPNSKERIANLTLIPREPYPITLHFKAEFTCKNGYSYTCIPSSIVLNFEDLFLPLPVPVSVQHSMNVWRRQLFDTLWERFMEEQFKENKSTHCRSSFCLQMTKEEFPEIIEHDWKAFIVAKSNLTYDVAMFLPSKNHMLMKFAIMNDKPFVNIIIDNKDILPCVAEFLQNMNKTCA